MCFRLHPFQLGWLLQMKVSIAIKLKQFVAISMKHKMTSIKRTEKTKPLLSLQFCVTIKRNTGNIDPLILFTKFVLMLERLNDSRNPPDMIWIQRQQYKKLLTLQEMCIMKT